MPNLNCQQRRVQWVEQLERFADAKLSVAEFCRREAVIELPIQLRRQQLSDWIAAVVVVI